MSRPRYWWCLWPLLALGLPAAAQERKLEVPFGGTQVFGHLLSEYKVQPLKTLADLAQAPPQETLLILFGDLSRLPDVNRAIGSLAKFRQDGGAILIASDRPDHNSLASLRVSITGDYVKQPERCYGDNHDCPIVLDGIQEPQHPLFLGIRLGIVTNQPSTIRRLSRCSLDWLALFNDSAFDQHLQMFQRGLEREFIVGSNDREQPEDRVVVLAGHSVFFNGHLLSYRDNDNWRFAGNCVKWLTTDGQRRRVFWLDNGVIQTDLQLPIQQLPPLPLPTEQKINRLLHGLQQENFFNRLLVENIPKQRWVHGLFLLASVVLFVLGIRWFFRWGHHQETAVPLLEHAAVNPRTQRKLWPQRRIAVQSEDHLSEAAQTVARQWLASHVPGCNPNGPPELASAAGWWQRRVWQQQLQRVWLIAYGPSARLTLKQFRAWLRELQALAAALQQGLWRVGP